MDWGLLGGVGQPLINKAEASGRVSLGTAGAWGHHPFCFGETTLCLWGAAAEVFRPLLG